jgi:hypothetical protein
MCKLGITVDPIGYDDDNKLRQLSITSTTCDTSSSLTFKLGTILTQSDPAVKSKTPRSLASSTSRWG